MKFIAVMLLFALSLPALAKDKPSYQDGVLQSFRRVQSGTACNSGDGGPSRCTGEYEANYTIKCGEQTYVLVPAHNPITPTHGLLGLATKNYSLSNQLPGTPVKLRSDGSSMYVRVGNHESRYEVVEVH
jgi:hypothetical protein